MTNHKMSAVNFIEWRNPVFPQNQTEGSQLASLTTGKQLAKQTEGSQFSPPPKQNHAVCLFFRLENSDFKAKLA
jgi:hypothetical protein